MNDEVNVEKRREEKENVEVKKERKIIEKEGVVEIGMNERRKMKMERGVERKIGCELRKIKIEKSNVEMEDKRIKSREDKEIKKRKEEIERIEV